MNDRVDPGLAAGNRIQLASYGAKHFQWRVDSGVGCITLNRPERKNPLTFESYAELRDLFGRLTHAADVNVPWSSAGAGGNFCSGGDVHEIIGPLHAAGGTRAADVHAHDRRSGQGDAPLPAADHRGDRRRVRRCRRDPRRWPATCAWARRAPRSRSCSTRVGLAGCDMGACAMLPRIVGQGRASELLYTGRALAATKAPALGLLQSAGAHPRRCRPTATALCARTRAQGPRSPTASPRPCCTRSGTWASTEAIEAEAQAQAICMLTEDFNQRLRGLRRQRQAALQGD